MHIFLRAHAQILQIGSELFQVILLTRTWKTPHVMMEAKWMQAIYGMVHVVVRSVHVLHHRPAKQFWPQLFSSSKLIS